MLDAIFTLDLSAFNTFNALLDDETPALPSRPLDIPKQRFESRGHFVPKEYPSHPVGLLPGEGGTRVT